MGGFPQYQEYHADDYDVVQGQAAVRAWTQRLVESLPFLDARVIEDVSLSAFVANEIEHKLRRELRGWRVVRRPALQCAFLARRASTQSVDSSSEDAIEYDSTDYNIGSVYSTTSFVFTAPRDGFYEFGALGRLDSLGDGKWANVAIQKNSTTVAQGTGGAVGAAGDLIMSAAARLQLDKDDEIQVATWHNHGSARNIQTESFFYGSAVDELGDGQGDTDHPGTSDYLRLYSSCDRTVSLVVW